MRLAVHGDFLLLESDDGMARKAARLPLGETRGRNEAWLRDTLFANPSLLPIDDIEPAFGPLLPLCTELRTAAGPLDLAFINPMGRLTLVECKLWRNAEARRKVVAQVLDYARAIKTWSYADLQRQVSMATGRSGNVPFEIAAGAVDSLQEHRFIDNVSRSMREGRFLLLIAGDGIREDVGGIADLINRNAASGFSFGQVELALYEFPEGGLLVQPRAISRTQLIERHVVIVNDGGSTSLVDDDLTGQAPTPTGNQPAPNPIMATEAAWWEPVTRMRFDDPEQDPPKYRWRNHVRASLPVPGLWLIGYTAGQQAAVALSGNREVLAQAMDLLQHDATLWNDLPAGADIAVGSNGDPYISLVAPASDFTDDDQRRAWLCSSLNAMTNALRPRLRAMHAVPS